MLPYKGGEGSLLRRVLPGTPSGSRLGGDQGPDSGKPVMKRQTRPQQGTVGNDRPGPGQTSAEQVAFVFHVKQLEAEATHMRVRASAAHRHGQGLVRLALRTGVRLGTSIPLTAYERERLEKMVCVDTCCRRKYDQVTHWWDPWKKVEAEDERRLTQQASNHRRRKLTSG